MITLRPKSRNLEQSSWHVKSRWFLPEFSTVCRGSEMLRRANHIRRTYSPIQAGDPSSHHCLRYQQNNSVVNRTRNKPNRSKQPSSEWLEPASLVKVVTEAFTVTAAPIRWACKTESRPRNVESQAIREHTPVNFQADQIEPWTGCHGLVRHKLVC